VDRYFTDDEAYLAECTALLGPDKGRPTAHSKFEMDRALTERPQDLAVVDGIISATSIWHLDQWLSGWKVASAGKQPLTLAETADTSSKATQAIRTFVFDVIRSERFNSQREVDTAGSRRQLWQLIAALLAIIALIAATLLCRAYRRTVRRERERARMAAVDKLTGLGNRLDLVERTTPLCEDPRFASHLVGVLDMDRFKMVNDTWGHAVGDAVLVEFSRRLQDIIADERRRYPGTEVSVVRLGGDEFLFSLHSPQIVTPESVRAQLEEMRRVAFDVGIDTPIPVDFSIGIATAHHRATLSDLMSAADLAAYDEKSQRAAARVHDGLQSQSANAPPPSSSSASSPTR
jgi:diguanylate cyclase (GGDEF)-like protein